MAGGLITNYLAQGLAAARPAAPDAASGTLSLYLAYDTEVLSLYDWNDTAWQDIPLTAGIGDLLAANNLSDVASAATSRTNLGVGTGDSPQFTGVNIGHATDTTVTRTGAGDIAVEGNAIYRAGGTDVTVTDGGTGASTAAGARTNLGVTAGGNLIGIQVITATGGGTYTPTSGTGSVIIELLGAGAGGGGVAQPGGSNVALGFGGGGGGYVRKRLTADFSGASYSVGAKGTGGAAGANNGTAGGDTTFTDTAGSPTTYTASGGSAGVAGSAIAAPHNTASTGGGTGTNGDLNFSGGVSTVGIALSSAKAIGQNGGGNFFKPTGAGGGGVFTANSSAAGGSANNTTAKGCGGGGGSAAGTGAAVAGGDGADGLLIIYEYS